MENFTPVSGLVGGMLIGVAAALLLLLNGRISGISSIVGGLLAPKSPDAGWRVALVAGLLPFVALSARQASKVYPAEPLRYE